MAAQILKNKSREISYALLRVSYYIKRDDLLNYMDSLAFRLLHDVAVVEIDSDIANVNKALSAISVLDALVRLGHSIYEIEPVNATILVKELDSLNSAIRQYGKLDEQLPNLESFFSSVSEKKEVNSSQNNIDTTNGNGFNMAIRQSAIINRIKVG